MADKLPEVLERLADLLDAHGELTWQRCSDWTVTGRMPSSVSGTRGGGVGSGASDHVLEDRAGDRAAAAYWDELNKRATRLFVDLLLIEDRAPATMLPPSPAMLARACRRVAPAAANRPDRVREDAERLIRIIAICCPQRPKNLENRDLLAAQVAADGWCLSCWRNGKALVPVYKRQYRDRCRWCGDWRGVHGQDPPLMLVELKHSRPNGRLSTAEVDRALGRTG